MKTLARHRDLKCHDCGMPLEHVGQFHPWEACRLFERTHDSSVVAAWVKTQRTSNQDTSHDQD